MISSKDLCDLIDNIHTNAVLHGFWADDNVTEYTRFALMHAELSEALESHRKGDSPYIVINDKPEGWVVELIDCAIRILDYIGGTYTKEEIVLAWNATSEPIPYLMLMPDSIVQFHNSLTFAFISESQCKIILLLGVFMSIMNYVEDCTVYNPEAILKQKHNYNLTRNFKHGKRY